MIILHKNYTRNEMPIVTTDYLPTRVMNIKLSLLLLNRKMIANAINIHAAWTYLEILTSIVKKMLIHFVFYVSRNDFGKHLQ